MLFFFLFFFSSRRRHTRFSRDWSSDVCSSDLALGALRAHDMPWHMRAMRVVWYVEEHIMWPAHWFLLTLGGLVPALLNPAYAHSALGVWQAGLVSAIMGLCLPCLVLVIVVDWRLRPEHPDGEDIVDVLIGWASFALLPIVGLVLCAI